MTELGRRKAIRAALVGLGGAAVVTASLAAPDTAQAAPLDELSGLSDRPGADNTGVIQAALDLVRTETAGAVVLPRGQWPISGRITVYDGMCLRGAGSSDSYAATTLLANSPDAGVTIQGDGGFLTDLEIDGAQLARRPLTVLRGANRTIERVDVHDAVDANLVIHYAQNATFSNCTFNRSGGTGVIIDREAGGLSFIRCNVSNASGSAVSVMQSVEPTTDYNVPTHIAFHHSIFERGESDTPAVHVEAGLSVDFRTCIFSAGPKQDRAPIVAASSDAANVSFDSCTWSGQESSRIVALGLGGSARVSLNGTQWLTNCATFIDNPSGTVQMNGDIFSSTANVLASPSTPAGGDQNISTSRRSPISFWKQALSGLLLEGRIVGEPAVRFRLFADGQMRFGDGSEYSFPLGFGRRSDGRLGLDGPTVVNGDLAQLGRGRRLGFFGKTPTAQPRLTYSRRDENDANRQLRLALAQLGLVSDQTTR